AAAWERLMAARAVFRRARADLYPQLDGFGSAEVRDGTGVDDETEFSLGLEASYEVDLWGRIQSTVDAERLRASATEADYRTAAITLSAAVALTWYQLAESRLQLELIESQIETNLRVLEVLEKRFAVGQSGSADVLRQRQLVESTREQAIVAQALVELFEHQLAVLEGRPPQGEEMYGSTRLPNVRETPSTGLPSELLQRRPDVRSALFVLEAADEDVAAAVADQYPRIDLAAALVTTAEDPSDLFSDWLASLAGQIVAPLIDGGRRRAEVERTVAVRRQRLAEYGQIVLDAFREVEDALTQETYEVRRISSLEQQLTISRSTLQQLRSQYLNGAADYIDVLTALQEQQEIERSLLASRLDRVAFRIALYRALAGGFTTARETAESSPDEGMGEYEEGANVRG
ncbi:MAG: efflux transporter outer membrane subunit, partial [Planctomycetota bacterium]|nr:efflux transporter outer membrane subunit [Planctomycetota bacterium]